MKVKKILSALLISLLFTSVFANENSSKAAKQREAVCEKVKSYIGCPYRTGGIGPDSFDCSGLVYTVFREAASVQLPRSAKAIYSAVKIISSELIEEGDLVFFKTTGNGQISHVGIYIGRNQFIHAASDGSNTGVIVSSLDEKYYKNCFAGVGKVLPAVKKNENSAASKKDINNEEEIIEEEIPDDEETKKSEKTASKSKSSAKASSNNFLSNISFDSTLACDWSIFLPRTVMIHWRGILLTADARFTKWKLQPGIGTQFRWNQGTECFQIPITLNLSFNDFVKVYFGPVITIGYSTMPELHQPIAASFFPGIFGISFNTPSIKLGKINVSLSQDISYTVFRGMNGVTLPVYDSLSTGLVFSAGIRVTLPLKNVLN